jgi:hypothetical protein
MIRQDGLDPLMFMITRKNNRKRCSSESNSSSSEDENNVAKRVRLQMHRPDEKCSESESENNLNTWSPDDASSDRSSINNGRFNLRF